MDRTYYFDIVENNNDHCTHLQVRFYYDLGGTNYFTYECKKRGYYLSVTPVECKRNCVSFTAFTGVKDLLVECKRQSKKAENEALQRADIVEKILIDYICKKYGYKTILDSEV